MPMAAEKVTPSIIEDHARNAQGSFQLALNKLQGTIESVPKDSTNPHFKSRYASLAAVNETIMGPLTENGFTVTQGGADINGKAYLVTVLTHVEGHSINFLYPLVVDANPQHTASQFTYARRYSLCALLNLSVEDDDGNASAAVAKTFNAGAQETKKAMQERTYEKVSGGSEIEKTFIPQDVKTWPPKVSPKNGKSYASMDVCDSDGNKYSTINDKHKELIEAASESSQEIKITYVVNGQYKNIKSVTPVAGQVLEDVSF